MVTTSKAMSPTHASSYFEKDDYYTKDSPGDWFGNGAKELGLEYAIDKKDFYAVANGFNPKEFSQKDFKMATELDKRQKALEKEFQNVKTDAEKSYYKTKVKEFNEDRKKLNDSNELTINQKVKVLDRGNIGIIIDIKEKKVKVEFKNKETKQIASKWFKKDEVQQLQNDRKLVQDSINKETGILEHKRAGFDMTASAPKSVSIKALVDGNKAFIDAHKKANEEMMKYAQNNFNQTRVWNGETQIKVNSDMLIAAQFTHNTARAVHDDMAPDPQLHTHNFLMNVVQDSQGKWRAMEPKELYKHQAMLGQLYQNTLAKEVQKLGYEIEWKKEKNGNYTFEIKGMDKEIKNFSKRTDSINEHLQALEKKYGSLSPEQKEVAKNEIRVAKEQQDLKKLTKNWKEQQRSLNTEKVYTDITPKPEIGVKEIIDNSIKEIEKYDSILDKHKIIHEALKQSQGHYSLQELDKAIQNNKSIFKINENEYGTKELLKEEKNIIETISKQDNSFKLSNDTNVDKYLDSIKTVTVEQLESGKKGMKSDQKAFIKEALTTKNQFSIVQGDAGTGKTHAVKELNNFIRKNRLNIELIGLAPTGKASDELSNKGGIKSMTIDKFLLQQKLNQNNLSNSELRNLGLSNKNMKWLNKPTSSNKEEWKMRANTVKNGIKGVIVKSVFWRISPPIMKIYSLMKSSYSFKKDYIYSDGSKVFKDIRIKQTLSMKFFGIKEVESKKTTIDKFGNVTKSFTSVDKSNNVITFTIKNNQITAAFKPGNSKEFSQIKSTQKKMYIVDESSMISTKKMNELVKQIGTNKAVFVGDKKQLKAVEQGSMFEKMQKIISNRVVNMTEKTRQKTQYTKEFVKKIEKGNIKDALLALEKKGNIIENKNINDLKNQFVKDVSNAMKKGKDSTVAIVPENKLRYEFNKEIREELKKSGLISKNGTKIIVLQSNKMSEFDKTQISNYKSGEILKTSKMHGDIKPGSEVKITKVHNNSKSMEIEYRNRNNLIKSRTIDLEIATKFEKFSKKEIEISKGDKIIFTRNNKDFKNGQIGEIVKVDQKSMDVKVNGKIKNVNFSSNKDFEHGYAMTTHKTQGMDTKNAFVYQESRHNLNRNSGYTAGTRVNENIKIYTDDKDKLIDKFSKEQSKENITDKKIMSEVDKLKGTGSEKSSNLKEEVDKLKGKDNQSEKSKFSEMQEKQSEQKIMMK